MILVLASASRRTRGCQVGGFALVDDGKGHDGQQVAAAAEVRGPAVETDVFEPAGAAMA